MTADKRDTKAHKKPRGPTDTWLDGDAAEVPDTGAALPTVPPQVTAPELMRDFLQEANAMSNEAFFARYPHPFLIRIASADQRHRSSSLLFTDEGLSTKPDLASNILDCALYLVKQRLNRSDPDITVGRIADNDIALTSSMVSKFHATFIKSGREYELRDHGSLNGTFLDGVQLTPHERTRLRPGSEVDFSRQLSFFFVDGETLLAYFKAIKG